MKRIESRNNPTVKYMNSLRVKRTRETDRLFYFEGVHLLEEYLRAGRKPHSVFVREDVVSKYETLLAGVDCEIYEVTSSVYDKLTDEKAPQGIFTVSSFLPNIYCVGEDMPWDDFPKSICGNSVMPVDLQDNGNVGTVIRTAAALDCDVVLCGSCADVYSPKTVRATMGALFFNNIYICPDPITAVEALQASGKRVIAAALTDKAEVLGSFSTQKTDCFAIGNEGNGLSGDFVSKCDIAAIIPMSGKTESLNAANAASIFMWEAKRGQTV